MNIRSKILIVANYKENKGGISTVITNHFKKLKDDDVFVEVFSTKRNLFRRIALFISLPNKVKKFDIIHIHGCSYFGFFPIVIGIISSKVLNKRKVIVTYHGGGAYDFLKKNIFWAKWFLEKADHITVMSEFLQDIFNEFGLKNVLLRNLIDPKNTPKHIIDLSFPKLVSIRSLTETYNISDILEAFILIKKEYPLATIQIAGTGLLESKLKKDYFDLDGVLFLGLVSNEAISTLLMQNNIFVSVPSFDNQPMSILEAFSIGIPVISSRVGGVLDMIEEGRNGFLVDVNSPSQIFDRVKWIFSNKHEMPEIINNAQQELVKYQWPAVRRVLLTLYSE